MTFCSTPFTRRFMLALVVAATSFVLGGYSCHAAEDGGLKKAVFQAWSDRQNKLESAKFEWTMKGRIRLSGMRERIAQHIRENFPGVGDFIEFKQPCSLRFDQDRFDYRLDTVDHAKLLMPSGFRSSFDGRVSQNYSGLGQIGSVGSGIITGEKYAFSAMNLYIQPMIFFFRPRFPSIGGIKPELHDVATQRVPIDEYSCITVEEVGDQPFLRKYWVDPEHDFIIRRYQSFAEGRPSSRIDISYTRDVKHGLVPTSWKTVTLNSLGEFRSSRDCTVVKYEINQAIPLNEFQIQFPAGTDVEDRVTGRRYVVRRLRL